MYNCKYCGKACKNINGLHKHERHCKSNPNRQPQRQHIEESGCCSFCGKFCKNQNSLRNHERYCKQNSNRQLSHLSNRDWAKGLTKETDERIAKHALIMQKFFQEHPEKKTGGYRESSVSYRYRYGTYKGFYCDSSWELAFLIYCLENNLDIIRNKQGFNYLTSDGKQKQFYPDFIIDNIYYEIKGGYDKQTKYKISQFPYKIVLIDADKIIPYLKYCIDKYGKDFSRLYDRNHSSWMDKETAK